MFIILFDESIRVEKEIRTSYRYKGIEIVKVNEDYYFKLDYPYDINDDLKIKEKKYVIENSENVERIEIYVYWNKIGINNFNIYPNQDISIIENIEGSIKNNDQYLRGKYLLIKDKHIFTNYEHLLVNDLRYHDEELKHGDLIKYQGVEIYFYKDFLYINSFNLEFNIKPAKLKEKTYLFKQERVKISNYYKRNYSDVVLNKFISFNPPRKTNDKKLIYQIGPSISMSMAMISIAGINIYNSYLNNGFTLSIIALGIMPLTIMLSGILWPVLNRSYENRKYKKEYSNVKESYLNYLKDYEKESLKEIDRFLNDQNYYAFNLDHIENKLFYINKNSDSFLKLNIGKYTKELSFKYEKTNDEQVDNSLLALSRKITSIGNAQLFIDLKKDKRVSVVTKNQRYYLLRFLLELSYKHSPDDLKLAIFTKDKEMIEIVYNLNHLYDGKTRYIFNDKSDLHILKKQRNNIVLLSDEPLEIEDENLIIIDIIKDQKEILKYSDVVVQDYGVTSYVTGKTNQIFEISKEKIDFEKYFNYLAKLENNNLDNKILKFLDSHISIDDIERNYRNHDNSLKAQFGYVDGKLLDFDIHESKDGPHGLIGGSTGSGKSELIISLLLSLVFRYPPDYLNIILIDYKGGGIKESLTSLGKTVPHIIASVNNLEEGTFERLVVAIDFELKKRQKLFRELSLLSSTSIMSIDDYLSLYKDYDLKPLAHLLIVVDEFAELKKENPEIIKELISFSRIGRSLGLHLILATQKPSGVIDDEIWSNSRFKIALKVHSEKDSQDIIKTKDAYYLKRPGDFYIKVDEILRKGVSIYSKSDVYNEDKYEIGILDYGLNYSYKRTINNKKPLYESTFISQKIIEITSKLNIETTRLNYLKPKAFLLEELIKVKPERLVCGVVDDYLNSQKGVLSYSLNDNLLIYSNRRKEMNNIVYQLNKAKRKMVIIGDKRITTSYICDFIEYDDAENLYYLFNKLLNNKEDEICVVIEDINSLISYDENYQDYLVKLSKRQSTSKYNLIVISNNSAINFKILNNFKNRLAIEINDRQDLTNIFSAKGESIAKSYFFKETPIPFVPCQIIDLKHSFKEVNSYLDLVPEVISVEERSNDYLLGYVLKKRQKVYLKYDESLLITGYNEELLTILKRIYNYLNVSVYAYEDKLSLNKYANIIWIGDGIYNQRLFYPERDVELEKNVGYLYKNGKGRMIKLINHE